MKKILNLTIFLFILSFFIGCDFSKIKNKAIEIYNEQVIEKDLGFYECSESTSYTTLYIPHGLSIYKFDGKKVSWEGGFFSAAKIKIPSGSHTFEFDLTMKLPMWVEYFDQNGFWVNSQIELCDKTWTNGKMTNSFFPDEKYSFWFYVKADSIGAFNNISSFDYGVDTISEINKIDMKQFDHTEVFLYRNAD